MEPAELTALQLGALVRTQFLHVAGKLSLAVKATPAADITQLLARYDIHQAIVTAISDCGLAAHAAVDASWHAQGASATREQLGADVTRAYASAYDGLAAAITAAWASVPGEEFTPGVTEPGRNPVVEVAARRATAVRHAVLGFAAALALRNKLSVTAAAGFSRTEDVLAQAALRASAGEDVQLEWVASRDGKDPRSCWWCRWLHGERAHPGEEFPHPPPHGARQPPRLYTGHLSGPPLHPRCRCKLVIVAAGEGLRVAPPPLPEPADFISSDTIRALPQDQYASLRHFLSAALHELGQILQRLAHPHA